MKNRGRMLWVVPAAALLLTGCGRAERIPDETWLAIMEDEIIRRDGHLPGPMPVLESEQPTCTEAAPTEAETLPETTAAETEAETEPAPAESSGDWKAADADDVYEAYCRGLEAYKSTVVVFGDALDGDMLEAAYDRVVDERPDLFWVGGYTSTYSPIRAEVSFTVAADLTAEQLAPMYEALMEKTQEITAGAKAYATDRERILYVHDYLVTHTVYDTAGAASISAEGPLGLYSTAYGCIVDGSAVCQGYAEAFKLLMQQLDIPCGICSGMAGGESHAWNWVQLDGKYYWIDVTWDDPTSEDGSSDSLDHGYFLINDEMLLRTRSIDDEGFIPTCTSLDDNYYVVNGGYLTTYSFDDIDYRMTQSPSGSIDVMFANGADYADALYDLFEAERIWDAAVFDGNGGRYVYSNNDDMYTLQIEFYPN